LAFSIFLFTPIEVDHGHPAHGLGRTGLPQSLSHELKEKALVQALP